MDDIINVPKMPKPAQSSANKAIYILVADDPRGVKGVQHYLSAKIIKEQNTISIYGSPITKTQADKIRKENISVDVVDSSSHVEITYQRLICIENITYRNARRVK